MEKKKSEKQLANEKSERIMQGIAYWASFYRHQQNPQRFVKEYLNADDKIFNWDFSENTFAEVYPNVERFKEIPPKFDFFKKHESQLVEKK